MKVKLLKKVRKRYEIIKVDKIAIVEHKHLCTSDYLWQSCMEDANKINTTPFFVITDKSHFNPFCSSHKTKSEALAFLALRIKSDYTKSVKSAKEKTTKVWHI